jgi:Ca2+-binding RTX toxin-like protein
MWKPKRRGAHANRRVRRRRLQRVRPVELAGVELLDRRVLPAVTATFSAVSGDLRIVGDAQDDTVVVSRDAGGAILVNGGAVAIQGGTPTVASTTLIFINGEGGDDNLSLDETNGTLPAAAIFGGDGNDTLIGGSGDDFIEGGEGNDTISLGAGDDTAEWAPGDGSDTIEGGAGRDSLVFNGSDAAENFDLSASGNHALLTRDVGGVAMDLNGVEEVDLNTLGGADTVTVNDQSTTGLNTLNLDLSGSGGTFDDQIDTVVINGTDGNDVGQIRSVGTQIDATVSAIPFVHIIGEGPLDALEVNTLGGDDMVDASDLFATNASQLIKLTVDGGGGNDTLIGSPGADTFVWNPGDGSDTIDGGDGPDTMVVNGSDAAERFDVSASGARVHVTHDVDGGTVDLGGVETITLNPLGGADTVNVNDLTGIDPTRINLNLAGAAGGDAGDGQADSVIVNGSNAADVIPVGGNVNGNSDVVAVGGDASGLPYFLVITATEGANDTLTVNGNGGDDTVDASRLPAGLIGLTVAGGAGSDSIVGSQGDDTFIWNPGDGSDTVDGQAGSDRLVFNGSDESENVTISANGNQVRLTRDVASVTMNLNNVETIGVNALGGADTITVNNLSGSGLTLVDLNLNNSAGSGDGQADSVIVNGTDGADHIEVLPAGNGTSVEAVVNFFPFVRITGAEAANDELTVNAQGGDDIVDASLLPANLIGLTLNGGAGSDQIFGSPGSDLVSGGPGDDTVALGDGDDTFVWNPGDGSDTVDGQGGSDRLVFNGSDASESIAISLSGDRVRLTRDVGAVAMDLVGIEEIDVHALGGADTITVSDPPATDLSTVNVDLAGTGGSGDGQADSVIVNGTEGNDNIQVLPAGSGTGITVAGLIPTVNITGAEATNDHLTINALGGDDVVDASSLPANRIGLTLNGGAGNNTILTTTATISIQSSLPNSTYGQQVIFTATVNPPSGGPSPTGTVQFVVDGANFGAPVPLVAGIATSDALVNLGAGSHAIVARYSGDANYGVNTDHLTQAVNKAHLTVTADPKSKPYGEAIPALTATISGFTNGDGPDVVGGSPGLVTTATFASGVGTYAIVVDAGTLAAANYDFPNRVDGTLIVNKATPTLTWSHPADIAPGTPLGPAQLDAVASIPGTIVYSPAAGTILNAGRDQVLTATLTPADSTDYSSVVATATINVLNATPTSPPHATGVIAANHNRKGLISITVAFDEALNPELVNNPGLYSVRGGVKAHGKTVHGKTVRIRAVNYDDTAHTVTINLARPSKGLVQVTIRPGIVAADGRASDGSFSALVK